MKITIEFEGTNDAPMIGTQSERISSEVLETTDAGSAPDMLTLETNTQEDENSDEAKALTSVESNAGGAPDFLDQDQEVDFVSDTA